MGLVVLSLFLFVLGGGLWWFMSRKLEVKYTKMRLLGVEIDRVIFINKFKTRKKTSTRIKRRQGFDWVSRND